MELIIGKQFKLEVWEAILKQMSLNEVAKFRVHKSVCRAVRSVAVPKYIFFLGWWHGANS